MVGVDIAWLRLRQSDWGIPHERRLRLVRDRDLLDQRVLLQLKVTTGLSCT